MPDSAIAAGRRREVDLGEFIKAGGSAKCLTLRLDGEDERRLERTVVKRLRIWCPQLAKFRHQAPVPDRQSNLPYFQFPVRSGSCCR